ncbi:hypothetical protein Cob_v002278 [Colletotrichum orbiculare MAFF 240422]|uniref:Uncharacterized protein n=1 Tax=Colletotrichum orbiculare (strain 104-T / ATCC 96160 / CBS 514.97 / LARS 414 / MAFF 240422) TaxID=1213857 RepID=A0A484G2Y7_COLOR|nr:hypothetical protein Cob_v002278 [Colletotrichum orbiculare MAFF 240422]
MVDPIPPRADRIVMYGNVTKRPLSSGGTTTSAPAKRIAIEMNHAPRDPVVFRNTLESSKNDVAFDHFDVQENCPPLPLDPFGPLTSEIRQTPSSVIFPLDANETESELESSWMNEFVDFDQTDLDIPSPGTLSLNTTSAESQTLSVEHDEPFHKLHSTITDHVSSVGDGYGLVDSDEEDLARLIETSCSGLPKLPSTCATQMTPRDSRSPTRFDAKLQHSLSTPGKSAHSQISTAEPDLLDDDVDWDLVTQCVTKVTANDKKSDAADGDSTSSTLAPFTRPPFPAKHFQLRDLFSDNQPYLTGTFKDWRNGSCADAQSRLNELELVIHYVSGAKHSREQHLHWAETTPRQARRVPSLPHLEVDT